jgi:hypothetical protein
MGLITFEYISDNHASSMEEAYQDAVRRHKHHFGHRSRCGGIGCTAELSDVTPQYMGTGDSLQDFQNKVLQEVKPGRCYGIEMAPSVPNLNAVKSTMRNTPTKGEKKWELRYELYHPALGSTYGLPGRPEQVLGDYPMKNDAEAVGRGIVEQTKRTVNIRVIHKLKGMSPENARITYKPSASERGGTYLFFGWVESDSNQPTNLPL